LPADSHLAYWLWLFNKLLMQISLKLEPLVKS